MGRTRRTTFAVTTALAVLVGIAGIVACAKIAGLEDADTVNPLIDSGNDGGNGLPETAEGAVVSPAELTIEDVGCGAVSKPGYITIRNESDAPVAYEVRLLSGETFALSDGSSEASSSMQKGTVAPKAIATVYVRATSPKPGTFSTDIVVTTGTTVQQIPVRAIVKGVAIALSPPVVDFGEVRKDTTSAPLPFEIANTGNVPVTITGFSLDGGTEFDVADTSSVTIEPGMTASKTLTFTAAGAAGQKIERALSPQIFGLICGETPTIQLKGTPVDQNVTVTPGTLEFGNFDCGSTPSTTKDIVLTNYSSSDADVSLTLQAGAASWFTMDSAPLHVSKAGTSPSTSTRSLGLKPLGTMLGTHTETLDVTITTNPAQLVPKRTVMLRVDVSGAILEITPAQLSGFTRNQTRYFDIRNVGNAFTFLNYTISGNGFSVEKDDPLYPVTDSRGVGQVVGVKFSALQKGTYNASISALRVSSPSGTPSYPTSAALCAPAPVVTVTATR